MSLLWHPCIRYAYLSTNSVVAYTSLAFGVVALVGSLLCKDIEPKMNNHIEVAIAGEEEKSGVYPAGRTAESIEMGA